MMADGRDVSDLFAAVVKNVVSKNVEASCFVFVWSSCTFVHCMIICKALKAQL